MKEHTRVKCPNCDGHGVVASYDMDGFMSPDECSHCAGAGTIIQYRNGTLASWYGGPLLGWDRPADGPKP